MRTTFRYRTAWPAVMARALTVGVLPVSRQTVRAEDPKQAGAVNADAAVIADFMKRVEAYVALHHKVDSGLQEPPRDGRPETFILHEQAFAKAIQRERPYAAAGDIFTKPMRNIVRRLLASVFRGPSGREIKKSILDEDTSHIPLQVNMQYPEGTPLSTTPSQIIQGLPKLPEGLEYRFIGQRLILLDAHARLIVDVVDRVFP